MADTGPAGWSPAATGKTIGRPTGWEPRRLHRYSIIACARWETPYIAEWIAYYEAIGFDHIYLYCNDDDPAELAAAVADATKGRPGFVSFTHFAGQGRQREMYLDALNEARRDSEWVTFLDIDEFLVLRGCDDIHAFMEPLADAVDSIHFNWVYFGNNGFVERPGGAVLPQYTVRAPKMNPNTKHITRAVELDPARLAQPSFPPFWHGLSDPVWSDLKRVDVLGAEMGPLLADFPRTIEAYVTDPPVRDAMLSKAVVNHYAFKSEKDFLFRASRGTSGDFAAQVNWKRAYENGNFRHILDDLNQVEDTYLSQLSARILPGPTPPAPPRVPLPPLRTVHVQHTLWSSDVQLGGNGRLRHAQHGSLGSYRTEGPLMRVKWDSWAQEDVFAESGGVFSSVPVPLAAAAG